MMNIKKNILELNKESNKISKTKTDKKPRVDYSKIYKNITKS